MVAGMGRGETGADGAIIHEDPYIIGDSRVLAGAKPEDQTFHPVAADQVAEDGRHNKGYGPPATFYSEIKGNKNKEEQVKRHPEFCFSQKGENIVQQGVGPFLVNPGKQPIVPL